MTYRLRKYDMLASVVNVQLRTKDFEDISHQRKLLGATSFDHKENEKQEKLDKVVDELKQKYGYNSVTRAGKLHSEDKIKLKDI